MFIYTGGHDVGRRYVRRTHAANYYTFIRERYNCVKYNSPYHKGSLLWDNQISSYQTRLNSRDVRMVYTKSTVISYPNLDGI